MEHLNYTEKPTTSYENEIHLNVKARNCIFSIDMFNQVYYMLTKVNEIRQKLQEPHNSSRNVREKKHLLSNNPVILFFYVT
jgi:hypothetical protein